MEIRRPRDERELAAALALREEVFCGEQGVTFDGALPRYERAGSTPSGERFDEEGIEHLGMEKHLA